MQVEQRGATGAVEQDASAELASLRATCRRQAWVIGTMTRVLGNLRAGVRALKSENAELRAAAQRAPDLDGSPPLGGSPSGSTQCVEVSLPRDERAPGAARIVVAQVLGERVCAVVLEQARLVISELVTNCVRHSGGSADAGVVVRVRPTDGEFWLEVEDRGAGGASLRDAGEPLRNGGFGLPIVNTLSEQWGIQRSANGGTRAWAKLSDAAPSAGADSGRPGEAVPSLPAAALGDEAIQPTREVHVIPEPRRATWRVYADAVPGALSEHTSETGAESAACAHARSSEGTTVIVVHDRYHRTHTTVPAAAVDAVQAAPRQRSAKSAPSL
jgi:anti-sigma regulatory factor (Ser/Thr protein kinase)